MKLFDKMFNYELQAELVRDGDCREAFPVTSTELAWLKNSLRSASAAAFLQPETLTKLAGILASYEEEAPAIVGKAAVANPELVPSKLFGTLRQVLRDNMGVCLSILSQTSESAAKEEGWPVFLEFNTARREWYLVWLRLKDRKLRFTPLRHILKAEFREMPNCQELSDAAAKVLEERRLTAVVELSPAYPADRHRVLSSLSAFDCDVSLQPGGVYRVGIRYVQDEEDYLLQRIRFLGLRVKILAPTRLIDRMRDTVAKVSALYPLEKSE